MFFHPVKNSGGIPVSPSYIFAGHWFLVTSNDYSTHFCFLAVTESTLLNDFARFLLFLFCGILSLYCFRRVNLSPTHPTHGTAVLIPYINGTKLYDTKDTMRNYRLIFELKDLVARQQWLLSTYLWLEQELDNCKYPSLSQ